MQLVNIMLPMEVGTIHEKTKPMTLESEDGPKSPTTMIIPTIKT
jgi:hypothetical protein